MENFFYSLVNARGDIVAIVVSVLVILGGLVLRQKGWILPDKTSAVSDTAIKELSEKVGAIDHRLRQVETDVEHLPTREELHSLHLQMVAMDGKIAGVDRTATATGHAVRRSEDHFIRMSGGNVR